MATEAGKIENRIQVGAEILKGKGYYYIIGKTSFKENGNIVERPLKSDKLTEFAEKDLIFWMNKDNAEVKLEIRRE